MQQNGIYDLLRALEVSIEEGFPIVPGHFCIINTHTFRSQIKRIYESIPPEIQRVHQSRNLCNEIYNLLREIEISLEQSFHIFSGTLTVINIKQINFLIEKIYASIPTEIQEARSYLKSL